KTSQTFFNGYLRFKPQTALRLIDVCEPSPHRSCLAGWTVFRWKAYSHDSSQGLGQLSQTRLSATRDIDHVIRNGRVRSHRVRSRDIVDEDKIHRLTSIPKDQ